MRVGEANAGQTSRPQCSPGHTQIRYRAIALAPSVRSA